MLVLAALLALEPPVQRAASQPASAPPGIELRWSAPEGCPGREIVEARLAELLGPRVDEVAHVLVDARVEPAAQGYALQLQISTAAGSDTHMLASADCRVLADGAALVAAVAADPLAVDRTLQEPAAIDVPPPEEPVVAPPPKPVTPPRPRAPLRLLRFALRAEGMLTFGVLPKLAFGPVVSLGLIGPRWRGELAAIYLAPQKAYTDATKAAGVAISSWALRLRGCGVPVWKQLEFPLCAGFEGGQLNPEPLGATMPTAVRDRGFGLFSAGGAIGYSPRPFIAVFAGADAIVPLVRPRFVIGGVEVHKPGPAGVRAVLGLELRVP